VAVAGGLTLLGLIALSSQGIQLNVNPVQTYVSPFEERMLELDKLLDGRVVLPSDVDFCTARTVWNQLSAMQLPPKAVVEVASERDVQLSMRAVVELNVSFSVRSGGHSKAGYSNAPDGVMISLKNLNQIRVTQKSSEGALAIFGPGIKGPEISDAILPMGYSAVFGQCDNVAEGGFVLGGGWGIMTRKHGLGLDNLISARIVLGNADVIEANATHSPDLFWALRGAGIGNFGIVTEMKYQLHPAQHDLVCSWDLTMPADQAVEFIRILGTRGAPRELHLNLETVADPMVFSLVWHCPEPGCQEAGKSYLREMAGYVQDVTMNISDCTWSNNTYPSDNVMLVQSYTGFLKPANVTTEAIKSLLDTLTEWTMQMNPKYVMPDMELWGGAISDVPSDATAFPHRDAVYNIGVVVEVPHEQPELFRSIVERLDREWYRVGQFLEGSYINYQMASLSQRDYPKAYWGSHVPRLQEIKRKYDPRNIFAYPQSIPA